ncbi:hypothetical protein TIFTF001_045194 [Ficus carica]|uniref:Uncharacterized protein n=1 Tax=Ficus carica TaxID=3494 RepID=A0AA87Z071_FICCA|nr:hypothetical protein TIFTF001_045194 [Ficus carica]
MIIFALPKLCLSSCISVLPFCRLLTAERLASISRNTRSHWVLLPEPYLASTPVNDSNLITLPPHIPSPIVCPDLHNDHGIDKQHHVFNPDSKTAHDDCNAGRLNVTDAARHSNEKSTTPNIGAHSIANNIISQSDNVPSSDSFFSTVVVADFTPVTMRAEFGVSFNYLRAWRGKEAVLTSLRGDDAESYKGLPAWAEMVKMKNPGSDIHIETDSENCFKYFFMCLAASKHTNLVFPDAAFGICVQHLAANLKTRYKDFKDPLKTYFDGASRSYLVSRSYKVIARILQRTEVCNHDNQHCRVIKQCGSESQADASWILGGMVEGTTTKMVCPKT